MGQNKLKEQVLDLLARRLAAYQELLDTSSRQYGSACKCDMDEFNALASQQDGLISKINQLDIEFKVLTSDGLFQETEMYREFMAQADMCMQKLQETYQDTQRVLLKKRDEAGKELLMLRNRSKVLNSYKQGGISTL